MAYQIKSTPFFRRILTTSKKNGQLQKLKEEYERMKEFNDRAIEMKMRQVRLKRLFKEIEEIKESSTQFRKKRRMSAKTTEEIRFETLIKAKELGKEYSKMNALLVGNNGSCLDQFAYATKSEDSKKHMIAKATSYGNEYSKANSEKSTQAPRKSSDNNKRARKTPVNESQEKLKQRNSYGNFRSSINMSKILNKRRLKTVNTKSGTREAEPAITRIKIISCQSADKDFLKSYGVMSKQSEPTSLKDVDAPLDNTSSLFDAQGLDDDDSNTRVRALQHWHKIALVVRHRFYKRPRLDMFETEQFYDEELLPSSESATDLSRDSDNDSEYDNGKDKEKSVDTSAPTTIPEPFDDATSNEVLVKVEPLTDQPWKEAYHASDYVTPSSVGITGSTRTLDTNTSNPRLERLSDLNDLVQLDRVQRLAKIFEPVVREAAQKEACESVRKLKGIFEHH